MGSFLNLGPFLFYKGAVLFGGLKTGPEFRELYTLLRSRKEKHYGHLMPTPETPGWKPKDPTAANGLSP